MPTKPQGQRFFSSNDIVVKAQFEQEAKLWTDAFKANMAPKATFVGSLGTVGLVLQLVINLIWLIFYGIGSAAIWLFGSKSGGKLNMNPPTHVMPDKDTLDKRFENVERVNFYE